jgi:hypothetical protein
MTDIVDPDTREAETTDAEGQQNQLNPEHLQRMEAITPR